VMDLANPSSDIGWAREERASLLRRGPADMVMLLAMIHHLALTNNTPFAWVASFLSRICRHLIIEFVPLIDSQAQRLVRGRDGLSDGYRIEVFEAMFDDHFEVMERSPIADTERVLYLMKNRGAGRDERK